MNSIWITIISGLLILFGTLGSVLPFLPGLPVAWVGLLIYSWYHSFPTASIWGLIAFGILISLTVVMDILAPAIAAKGRKASKHGVLGAIIGGILGIFILGPIGIILGPFIGAFLGEIINSATTAHAFRIAVASLFGLVIGSAFKLLVGITMLIYFVVIIWAN